MVSFLGWDGYDHAWNLVKYALGSDDDIGNQENGDAEHGLTNWDSRHRYSTDLFGGRDNWEARAKAKMGWALTATMPGTPMLFILSFRTNLVQQSESPETVDLSRRERLALVGPASKRYQDFHSVPLERLVN
jgi:hypothetical protein